MPKRIRGTVTQLKLPEAPPSPPEGLHKLECGCHELTRTKQSAAGDWVHQWHPDSARSPYSSLYAPQAEKNFEPSASKPPGKQLRKAAKVRLETTVVRSGLKKPNR